MRPLRRAIIAETADTGIVWWGPAAEDLYGYRAEEMVGADLGIIVTDHHELSLVRRRFAGGRPVEPSCALHRHKSGRLLIVDVTWHPLIDNDRDPFGLYAVITALDP